jgi:NCS2 family nucleobase:cation symporter-2
VAVITLVIVTGLNHYGTGIWKLFSILIGIIAGYGVWLCFGMVDFSAVSGASLFQLPRLLHFGTIFEPSACVAIGILFAINSIQAIGDFTAITTGGMDRMPTDEELNGGIVAYRFCNIISALFGGLPTAMFSQNVGIVSSTKVVAKRVFASIAMTGVKLIMAAPMDYRNTTIVGLFIAFRMGITQDSGALANFPAWVTTIFGKSPVVPAAITAITLNLALPGRKRELGVLKEGAAADAIVVEYIARILRYIYWLLYWPLTMQGAGFLS